MYRPSQDASAGAHNDFSGHHNYEQGTGNPPVYPISGQSPMGYAIDPSLQASPQHLRPSPMARYPSHQRSPSADSHSMGPPSATTSPRFSAAAVATYEPTDRSLPSRSVTDANITDVYVSFILYCNPSFAPDIDKSELRRAFNNPPKSDNKEFEVFRLFELIQLFDTKEIKTWNQLALDLGVEPPDTDKGQSVQKVQQYSVRLKRWMRSFHIDAFFDYLLGKEHAYFNIVPPPSDPFPANGRDGVMAEEDLAIRALDPSFRPKRGRRRNDEATADEGEVSARKRPMLTTSFSFEGQTLYAQPQSAIPQSALPLTDVDPWAAAASAVSQQSFAPWATPRTAVDPKAPSHLRWQLHGSSQTPSTPHPMTALPTSMSDHIHAAFENEPRSAITPSSSRKRRKHGPAVSSAWPSANGPNGKLRGRPPASRNVQDGPYGTFPADPDKDKSPKSAASNTAVVLERSPNSGQPMQPPPLASQPLLPPQPRQRLSLQVPQSVGGPVRLATPTVLVNGETNGSSSESAAPTPITAEPEQLHQDPDNVQALPRPIPGFAYEALKRILTSDLLRAELSGRKHRLSGSESRRLADSILSRLKVPVEDTEDSRDDIARLTAASWLGLGGLLNVPLGVAASQGKKIAVTRFRTDNEGYEEVVSATDESTDGVKEIFDISWLTSLSGLSGTFEMKGLALEPALQKEDAHDAMLRRVVEVARSVGVHKADEAMFRKGTNTAGGDSIDWKAKYQAMEFGAKLAKGEVDRVKERILDVLLG